MLFRYQPPQPARPVDVWAETQYEPRSDPGTGAGPGPGLETGQGPEAEPGLWPGAEPKAEPGTRSGAEAGPQAGIWAEDDVMALSGPLGRTGTADPAGHADSPDLAGRPEQSDPVFVDASGRRARVVRRAGWIMGGVSAAYTATLLLSLMGATSIAPRTLLPLPGVPSTVPDHKGSTEARGVDLPSRAVTPVVPVGPVAPPRPAVAGVAPDRGQAVPTPPFTAIAAPPASTDASAAPGSGSTAKPPAGGGGSASASPGPVPSVSASAPSTSASASASQPATGPEPSGSSASASQPASPPTESGSPAAGVSDAPQDGQ